jgi:hypothetical protein
MGTSWTPQQTKRIFSTNLSLTNVVEKEGSDETFATGDRYYADVVIIRERDKNTRHIRVKPHAVTSTHTLQYSTRLPNTVHVVSCTPGERS